MRRSLSLFVLLMLAAGFLGCGGGDSGPVVPIDPQTFELRGRVEGTRFLACDADTDLEVARVDAEPGQAFRVVLPLVRTARHRLVVTACTSM